MYVSSWLTLGVRHIVFLLPQSYGGWPCPPVLMTWRSGPDRDQIDASVGAIQNALTPHHTHPRVKTVAAFCTTRHDPSTFSAPPVQVYDHVIRVPCGTIAREGYVNYLIAETNARDQTEPQLAYNGQPRRVPLHSTQLPPLAYVPPVKANDLSNFEYLHLRVAAAGQALAPVIPTGPRLNCCLVVYPSASHKTPRLTRTHAVPEIKARIMLRGRRVSKKT